MKSAYWILPFAAQAVLMGVDELWFHRRRGLPRWERLGHPLDTSSVALCLGLAALARFSAGNLRMYLMIAVISCVLITKDELVHARRCTPGEHWVHAGLFVLHPISLLAAAWLWSEGLRTAIQVQLALVMAFLAYQIVYWNLLRRT